MKESGYKQSQGDHTLFIKHSVAGGVTALLVYVDDIIVTGNDEREKHEVKQRLAIKFEIKELGKLKYFLETGKIGCKPVSTPMDPNHKLGEAKEELVVDKECTRGWLVGSYTLFTLGQTSPTRQPRERNFVQEEQYSCSRVYTDADYASSLVDRRSTTGYCTFLGDDLRIKWDGPMKLYCDNKSTINIAHNPILHDRTKQNKFDRHFIKEKLEKGVVFLYSSWEWKTSIPQLEGEC
ncbi:Retrovirus-related Pol polyprotein from transposon RE1 [Vitis vinifera]|uniref:Retrovirus-related Pol polyprotein from transposon RE1 n=1 Tax=Vitis vinifera TaxID=29760 RepID=A0A438HEP5_VITVI|nr:Retrovirus-related Pol polyprotein from transposon RE1 [Vitis vinifera]